MTERRQYSISELAQEFDISTRTIRFYEEKGLLSPQRDGQKRIYQQADRTRLRLILRGKRLGLTLQESLEIIDMYDSVGDSDRQLQALMRKIRERKSQLAQQMEDIQMLLADLSATEKRCLESLGQKPVEKKANKK